MTAEFVATLLKLVSLPSYGVVAVVVIRYWYVPESGLPAFQVTVNEFAVIFE